MSQANSSVRRDVIRATWQNLHASPHITTCFFLENYPETYSAAIEQENTTHGDLIRLTDVAPGAEMAKTIKPIEFFKHLVATGAQKYDWVTKLDDDVYLVASKFYSTHILPRAATANQTLIARQMRRSLPHIWPQGAHYTLSWDLVATIVDLYPQHRLLNEPEDILIGQLLHTGKVDYNFVKLGKEEAFDVASPDTDPPGVVTEKALAVHMLKSEELYLKVASLFGREGWNGKRIKGITDLNWKGRLPAGSESGGAGRKDLEGKEQQAAAAAAG